MYRQGTVEGFSLTTFWNTIKGAIIPPKIVLPPIQIPGTTPPAPYPPQGQNPIASEMPSWLLPAGIAAVAGIALLMMSKRGRR